MLHEMNVRRSAPDEVAVLLTYSEALVLADLLHRWERNHAQRGLLDHPAEQRVLDDLSASFEPVIDEVFASDYSDAMNAARERVIEAP